MTLAVIAAAAIVSFCLTMAVRSYVIRRDILDHPNDRSMHDRPVPRGGGLAIALTFCLALVLLAWTGVVERDVMVALVGGAVMVTLIGWIDDVRRGIPALVRLAVQLAAAGWALLWLGGLPSIAIGSSSFGLGIVGSLLAAIGIVWWINLYNFMDGIDGIAAGQAVSVAAVGTVLLLLLGDTSTSAVAGVLAGAAAGFLVWNWSPARIFMGDAGSGFLGYAFAVIAIASERAHTLPLLIWLVISGVFIFDSTITLVRRVLRGERFYSPHRHHAYQRLVAAGHRHTEVTIGVIFLNLALGALALFAVIAAPATPYVLIAAVAVLSVAYLVVEKHSPLRRPRPPESSLNAAPNL